MKLFRKCGFIAGIVFLLWFALPLVVGGIFNIGNATGIVLSVLLIIYTKWMSKIHSWIKVFWKRKLGKGVLIVFVTAVITIVSLVVIESSLMIRAATKAPEENATAIVLGCRVYGERPSLSMIERLEAAYEYLEENPDTVCIVSGGKGDSENISEAEAMYRWLTDKGIEPSRIYKEENSTSTVENIEFSKEIIEENGLNKSIAIITSEYHTYRAGVIAEKQGLTFGAAPGKTAIWLFPTFYVRELYGILYEWVF